MRITSSLTFKNKRNVYNLSSSQVKEIVNKLSPALEETTGCYSKNGFSVWQLGINHWLLWTAVLMLFQIVAIALNWGT